MKLVTWNCNGAFRNKYEHISCFDADIYIIQECENPIESKSLNYKVWSENHLWIGDSKNKGLGIFAKKEIKLTALNWSSIFNNQTVKHFLPCTINQSFNLLGVWTHKNNSSYFGYIGQFWKYLQINKNNFSDIILAGDFNSSSLWHHKDCWWNHSDVINELNEMGIESFYHKFYNEEQGKETNPTLYFQKNIDKKYHIDYFFGVKKFTENLSKFHIGTATKWLELSDHMPMVCEIKI